MIKASPSSNSSVDAVAREAAKEAARRAGMTLGEYLNRVIAEQAAELGVEPHDLDPTTRVEALRARLARPPNVELFGGFRPHPRSRPGRERDAWRTRGGSFEKAYFQSQEERSSAKDDDPLTGFLSDTAVNDAPPNDVPPNGVAPNSVAPDPDDWPIAGLAEQLAEIEQRLRRSNGSTAPIRAALARLEWDLTTRRSADGALDETELGPLETDLTTLLQALRANSGAAPSQSHGNDSVAREVTGIVNAASHGDRAASGSAPTAIDPPATDAASAAGAEHAFGDEHSIDENGASDPIITALDQSLSTIAEQLGQAMAQGNRGAEQSAPAQSEGLERPATPPSEARVEIVALRSQMAELSRTLADFSPHPAMQALEEAVQQLAVKIDASTDPRLRESLVAPVETIAADLRNMLRSADSRALIEALDQDVKAMAGKIKTLVTDFQPTASDVRELRDDLTRLASKPMPFEKIEQELVSLAEMVEQLAAEGASRAAVGQIITGLDAVNRQLSGNAPAAAFKNIEQNISALAARLDQLASAVPGHKAIEGLTKRLDAAHQSLTTQIERWRPPAVDINGIETIVATLANKLDASAATEARNFSALDAQTAKIAARIERLAGESASRTHAAELAASLAEVRRSIAATAPADLMQAVSKRIDTLANKVNDVLLTSPTVAKNYEELTKRLDSQIAKIAERIERLAGEGASRSHVAEVAASLVELRKSVAATAPTDSMQALSKRLDTLTNRVDEVLLASPKVAQGYEELTKRIAAVHHSLAARLDMPPPPPKIEASNLEAMVRALAAKIDAVRPAEIEPRSLDSIEAQVSRIAEKIDRSDDGLVTLASLQRSILDLFAQLEETRHAALDAAETAARTAARDTLRQAMLVAPAPVEKSAAEDKEAAEEISRQLHEMRALQDNSDRRVNSTLSAVQGTLEQIAGRLATLNDQADYPALPAASALSAKQMRSDFVLSEPSSPGFESALDILAKAVERHGQGEGAAKRQAVPGAHEGKRNDDFLIEPGSGYPPNQKGEAARTGSGQASFIAAARRAAQAAAVESAAVSAKRAGAPTAEVDISAAKSKAWFTGYNLKLLLGLGCIAVISATTIGYQFAYGSFLSSDAPLAQISAAAIEPNKTAVAAQTAAGGSKEAVAISDNSQSAVATGAAPKNGASVNEDAAGATLSPMSPMTTGHLAQPLEAPGANSIVAPQPTPASSPGLSEAAQAGNAAAQYELGTRLADGRDANRDFKLAAVWFEKAATQGLAPAQFRLGTLYEKGLGVQRDEAIAKLWYQRAGERGNAHAMHNLAVLTAEGSSGKPDYATAAIWFRKAAELGVRDSQYNLAILYARGLGIEQSLPQSYLWFSLAAVHGDEDAAKKRDEVAARLDAKALDAAKALVAQFQAKVPEPSANDVVAPTAGWGAIGTKAEPKSTIRLPAKPKVSRL